MQSESLTHRPLGMIEEPSRSLPVSDACDVLVAGGGIAGVAAAVAAARQGARVCLLEKTCAVGGLATLGNVIVWMPLCDGRGRQVSGGLAEVMLKLSVADLRHDNRAARFTGIPACWQFGGDVPARGKRRYETEFNPASYLLALEKLVVNAGITLLYDTRLCAVRRDGDRISHVIVENKSGRSAVACRTVVDATGDADVCFLAGEPTESLDSNVLCGWFYSLQENGLNLHGLSNRYSPLATRENADGPFFRGDEAGQVTAQILGTRDLIRKRLEALRVGKPDADIQLVAPPTLPCFRMTRRLVGSFSLEARHVHQWFDDAVGLIGDWREAGPVYALPFSALHGVHNANLLVAGRCISADTTVWDVTRSLPGCAVTGEACGSAAALALRQTEGDVRTLSIEALQSQLRSQGVLLDPGLVAPAVS
ncbi:MAG: FAD-dependent oxidoreductase [bacterium]